MADIKLFRVDQHTVTELPGGGFDLEKPLQTLIERNMESLFAVRFVKSEHRTGPKHQGRIDSLGLDENNTPVIFEYKRDQGSTLINQGLFYLDWLVDHRGDFTELVRAALGDKAAKEVDWTSPRLVCVAGSFSRYDEHAAAQIGRSVELIRYKRFGTDLITLEQVYAADDGTGARSSVQSVATVASAAPSEEPRQTAEGLLANGSDHTRNLYALLEAEIEALGDDVTRKILKHYFGFKRLKSFAAVIVQRKELAVTIKADLFAMQPDGDFSRDVTELGHLGSGNVQLRIRTEADIERAMPWIGASYNAS